MQQRWHLSLAGVVQGIGLRPLLYRLSAKCRLTGWVQNTEQNVILEWQGEVKDLYDAFDELLSELAQYGKINFKKILKPLVKTSHFEIHPSTGHGAVHSLISPDISICHHCLNELYDGHNRRYQYPFINCAQCGPRYTICKQLPYDRQHSSMSKFNLCSACQKEYTNPLDRRFHAQTIACWDCGPQLWLSDNAGQKIAKQQAAISATIGALHAGKIIAIKGIGGFHLMALACHRDALNKLRLRKHRPDKPFVLMVKDLNQAMQICWVSDSEGAVLTSKAAPIVILKKKNQNITPLSPLVAPNQSHYGVMLAYTPLHYLLLSQLTSPLVATSANVKDEPLCYENKDAQEVLHNIADLWLMNDRDILHPIEDSIVQLVNDKKQFIRRARGYIPFALDAPSTQQSTLAVGGHLKNTVALHHQNHIYISPFIGDLDPIKSISRFQHEIGNFLKITPKPTFICDNHPDYVSTLEAKKHQPDVLEIQHHQAHIFAVMAEHQLSGSILGFAWDGLGLGSDGGLWGGETFFIEPTKIDHVASLYPFLLAGGEKAIKEPRRIVLSLLQSIFKEEYWRFFPPHLKNCFTDYERNLIHQLLVSEFQQPICTSMGRIFDALSFLLGGPAKMTFEGQAAMFLEQLANSTMRIEQTYPVELLNINNKIIVDWRAMIYNVLNDLNQNQEKSIIAYQFHHWCVSVICKVASKFDCKQIVLSGGVFQNKLLTELAYNALHNLGYEVYYPEQLPPNDSGLSVGQVLASHHLFSLQNMTTICV